MELSDYCKRKGLWEDHKFVTTIILSKSYYPNIIEKLNIQMKLQPIFNLKQYQPLDK